MKTNPAEEMRKPLPLPPRNQGGVSVHSPARQKRLVDQARIRTEKQHQENTCVKKGCY